MSNPNYIKGVALEREIIHAFERVNVPAVRTAGSHSAFDVICYPANYNGFAPLTQRGFALVKQLANGIKVWERVGGVSGKGGYVDTLYVTTLRDTDSGVYAYFLQAKRHKTVKPRRKHAGT